MAIRKLEGTFYLTPHAPKVESLVKLRRMVKTRQCVYLTAHPEVIDVINNTIILAYKKCIQKGAGEDEIKVAVSGLKEARL